MRTLVLVLLLFIYSGGAIAQIGPHQERKPPDMLTPPGSAIREGDARIPLLKRPGHYTVKDWHQLIDSLWGQGLSTAQQLSVFDSYWSLVDRTWGGFPNLAVNWDSLKNVYRPLIEAGVSRGRFYGILCRLTRALCEWHVYTVDRGIDATWGSDFLSNLEYPNHQSFQYQPGIPLINFNELFFRSQFGAGLSPLPDSTAVVYSVMPNHPLGLQPGDVILGYDRIPWKTSIRELLDAELPILSGGNRLGSTPAAAEHVAIMSVGNNWGLFDTIDVVKYTTKDTVHYPTSLLGAISPPYFIATEQMPVPGVPFPDIQNNKMVSWGVMQGTSIGYVYVWDWWGVPVGQTRGLFAQAINDLIHLKKVQGLILDFRTNSGGNEDYAIDGYSQLFNFDPTVYNLQGNRTRGGGHFAFDLGPVQFEQPFTPGNALFDRPIAVLTGPLGGSAADYNAFRMRFHPMVRFFGKPTAGAYTSFTSQTWYATLTDPYFCRVDDASLYSTYNSEGYLIHRPFPVDEEVWLTRDGVAKGQDDVVERALAWMANLAYAHDLRVSPLTVRKQFDTVHVTATVENPQRHALALKASTTDLASRQLRDSLTLYNDGLHGDGLAGDTVWGGSFVPSTEGVFGVNVRTDDPVAASSRTLTNVAKFATAGPLKFAGMQIADPSYDTIPAPGATMIVTIGLKNMGATGVIPSVTAHVTPIDSGDDAGTSMLPWGTINPGTVVYSMYIIGLYFSPGRHPGSTASFALDIYSQGVEFWRDTMRIVMTGIEAVRSPLPTIFSLEQNYPNPFNPSTTIRYTLPHQSQVCLNVYNTLGQRVATLFQGQQEAGSYEVAFDGTNTASGVYFYRIQAGDFVATKKLLLTK